MDKIKKNVFYIISGLIVLILVGLSIYNVLEIKNLTIQNQQKIVTTIKNIKIQCSKDGICNFVISQNDKELLNNTTDVALQDFMKEYYTVQSNWLNSWLTILAVILAFIGIITPIWLKNKDEEINKIIDEFKEKSKLDVNEIEKKLEETKRIADEASADISILDGLSSLNSGNYMAAELSFKAATEKYPQSDKAFVYLGDTYSKMGNYEDTVNCYKQAIKLLPENPFIWLRLAEFYVKILNIEKAKESIKEILGINPVSPYILRECGTMEFRIGDYEKAIEHLNSPLVLNKNSDEYFMLTKAYIYTNKYKEALNNYNIYRNLAPKNHFFNDLSGIIYWTESEKAIKECKEWIEKIEKSGEQEGKEELLILLKSHYGGQSVE